MDPQLHQLAQIRHQELLREAHKRRLFAGRPATPNLFNRLRAALAAAFAAFKRPEPRQAKLARRATDRI